MIPGIGMIPHEKNGYPLLYSCLENSKNTEACQATVTKKKKKKILPLATAWMDPDSIMLSEISQIEKDKYCRI